MPMTDEKKPVPRLFILGLALVSGLLISVAAQVALAKLGLDLEAVWRGLRGPQATQLRAAFAWWLIAGISFVGGFVIATSARYFSTHPVRSSGVRWVSGTILVVVLTLVARQATDRAGLSPAASVGIGLAVQCFAGVLSLLGAYFVARRW